MSITAVSASGAAGLEFTTDRASLVEALRAVGVAVSSRPPVPVLGAVLLHARTGALTVSATDYEMTVSVRVPATVRSPGTVVADHAELSKLLHALATRMRTRDAAVMPVVLRATAEGALVLELAGYTVPVNCHVAREYPALPDTPPRRARVAREELTDALGRVLVAAGTDDTLPMLCGAHLHLARGSVTLAASDRFRLAVAQLPAVSTVVDVDAAAGALIPARPVSRVAARFAGEHVDIGLDDPSAPSAVSLTCAAITVTVRTIDAQFPQYRRLLPDTAAATVQTDRAALLAAAHRADGVLKAKREHGHAGLSITTATVSVAPVLDADREAITAPATAASVHDLAAPMRFLFRPEYLIAALNSFTGDTITLHTQPEVTRPVLFTDTPHGLHDSAEFRHLLMPVRP